MQKVIIFETAHLKFCRLRKKYSCKLLLEQKICSKVSHNGLQEPSRKRLQKTKARGGQNIMGTLFLNHPVYYSALFTRGHHIYFHCDSFLFCVSLCRLLTIGHTLLPQAKVLWLFRISFQFFSFWIRISFQVYSYKQDQF